MGRFLLPLLLASASAVHAAPIVPCDRPLIADDARLSDAGQSAFQASIGRYDPAMVRVEAAGTRLRGKIERAVMTGKPEAMLKLRADEANWSIARANAAYTGSTALLAQLSPRDKAIYARLPRMNPDPREASTPVEQANRESAEAVRRRIVAVTRCPVADPAELDSLLARELALEIDFQHLRAADAGSPEQVRLAYLGKIDPQDGMTQVASAGGGTR